MKRRWWRRCGGEAALEAIRVAERQRVRAYAQTPVVDRIVRRVRSLTLSASAYIEDVEGSWRPSP